MSGENIQVDETIHKEFINDADKYALDLIKLHRALAKANVDKTELTYNNLVLQLTLKYSLKDRDSITEQGEILRGSSL